MSDYAPFVGGSVNYTSTASATITGGQVCEVSGADTVGPAGAGSTKVVGVALFDAASGAPVTLQRGGIQYVATAANVTAGDTLKAGAAGTVRPWVSGTDAADLIVGRALTSATSPAAVKFAASF